MGPYQQKVDEICLFLTINLKMIHKDLSKCCMPKMQFTTSHVLMGCMGMPDKDRTG